MKPVLLFLSMLLAASVVSASEPLVVVQPPNPPMPEDTCQEVLRLSVEPSKGGFVLATFREFQGVKVVSYDTPDIRKVVRLVFCPTKLYSEDISFRSDDPTRKRFVVSGFGQEVEVTGLDIPTNSGYSGSGGQVEATSITGVTRRFIFSDSKKEGAAHIFEYSLRAIDADEARKLARSSAITIPTSSDAYWGATLPPVKKQGIEKAVPPNEP